MSNGKSDIKLMDDFDGQVKVEAPDFCVDGGQGRRNGSTTPYRRAFVHDGSDGLIVNWANDYQGGVTINGVKTITAQPGKSPFPFPAMTIDATSIGSLNLKAGALTFTGSAIHLNCPPAQVGGVKITGNVQFDGKILFRPSRPAGLIGVRPLVPGQPPPPPLPPLPLLNLADVILELRQKIEALEKKAQIA